MISLLLAITIQICQDGKCDTYIAIPYPTTTTTAAVATTTSSTSTTLPPVPPVSLWGWFGAYDNNGATTTEWPKKVRMRYLIGGVDQQAALVPTMKTRAVAANNASQQLLFYLGFAANDSRCNCWEQHLGDQWSQYYLRDAKGNIVYTNDAGGGRVRAMDIGNSGYVSAWGKAVLDETSRNGWHGVLGDYCLRCNGFWGWSAKPINPRTGKEYTCQEYRHDMASALTSLRGQLHGQGKTLACNHSAAWQDKADGSGTFSDPLIQTQLRQLDAAMMEDAVYSMSGPPHSETAWLDQLRYEDYAVAHGVIVLVEGYGGVLGNATKRQYVLATALLTSGWVGQINNVNSYYADYDVELGVPRGTYECISGGTVVSGSGCPGMGLTYRRRYERGVVAVNPTTKTQTIPLGQSTATCGTSITLAGQSGKVCP